MNKRQVSSAADALERAAAKRYWLQQAEQFAKECGYVQVCPECGHCSADSKSKEPNR